MISTWKHKRQIDDSSNGKHINESNTKRADDFIDIIVIRSDIHVIKYFFSLLSLNKSPIELFLPTTSTDYEKK